MFTSQFGQYAFGVATVKDLNNPSICHNYVLKRDENTVLTANNGC